LMTDTDARSVIARSRLLDAIVNNVGRYVSTPIRVLSRSRPEAKRQPKFFGMCFNPYKGFKPIATKYWDLVIELTSVSIPIRVLSRSRRDRRDDRRVN